ncbi:Na+/H+ antiporter NhaA [Candidatus Jidaibacter acanthamoebae]|nr:Na+/H+ antiporter NhaA [Candidatus Jidaibacter acanthamoeba]
MALNLREFIKSEAFSGVLLICSLFLAVVISNTALYEYYLKFIKLPVCLRIGGFGTTTTFLNLINDGLMTLFFLLIGLEMKYHLVVGEYKERKKLILPTFAAIGGLVIPALIYMYFNHNQITEKGWAIPVATDTAFVLGILSFFARKISLELRLFIIGFSLIDDALAIIILALFYTSAINTAALLIAALVTIALFALNYFKVKEVKYYAILGVLLWIFIVEAGVHGTLAGVILAVFIPVAIEESNASPLKELEANLHPFVNYCILPIFAFINSEIPLKYLTTDVLFSNLGLGIILGLFFGKQVGIFVFSYLVVKLKWCMLPNNTSWSKYYAVCVLGGIGFTLSLFIGGLTFEKQEFINIMRSSVIIASMVSALFGILILKFIK